MKEPLGHPVFVLLSCAGMLGWTAMVHLNPPRFFLWATVYCAAWLFLSARAMGSELGQRLGVHRVGVALGVALGVLLYGASRLFLWGFCGGFSTALCGPLTDVYSRYGHGNLGAVLALAIVIAPAEELFWRGVVQSHLRPKLGRWGAVACATLLSSLALLIAGEPLLALAALPTSLGWGALAEARKSLIPAILSHALWDVLIVVVVPAV